MEMRFRRLERIVDSMAAKGAYLLEAAGREGFDTSLLLDVWLLPLTFSAENSVPSAIRMSSPFSGPFEVVVAGASGGDGYSQTAR